MKTKLNPNKERGIGILALGLLGGSAFTIPLMGQFLNAKDVLPASLTKKYLDQW